MHNNRIDILSIIYNGTVSQKEMPYFRGAVIASVGRDTDVLFHNHDGDEKYRYSYPLVQYKRTNGKACVVCINDAISNAGMLLGNMTPTFQIGNRKTEMAIGKVETESCEIAVTDNVSYYKILNWLPLNAENYKRYMLMDGMIERVELLQSILVGNIISMCKGLGIDVTEEIKVMISNMSSPRTVENKGVKLLSFDLDFKANITLPNHIGLGKNASLGYGVIEKL